MFYLNGINFCLRGGQEHRGLKLTQLKREGKYIENGSKSFRGGIADLRRENKVVLQFPNENSPSRCHVKLLDWYIEKLPAAAKSKDAFYYIGSKCHETPVTVTNFCSVDLSRTKVVPVTKFLGPLIT